MARNVSGRLVVGWCVVAAVCGGMVASGEVLSIRDVQETTTSDGTSDYDGQIVDCSGGVVVRKIAPSRTGQPARLLLADTTGDYADGWNGIEVKDWSSGGGVPFDLFDSVEVGDWVSFTDIYVEDGEYTKGTTFLQYDPGAGVSPDVVFSIDSHGNALPSPVVVTTAQIAAPIEDPVGSGDWLAQFDPASDRLLVERYEAVLLRVEDVTVSAWGLGKAEDNYNLTNTAGDAWAADFYNVDRDIDSDYHDLVDLDVHFASVTGFLEQYTGEKNSHMYDCYQLMTTCTGDFVVPEPTMIGLVAAGGVMLLRRRR